MKREVENTEDPNNSWAKYSDSAVIKSGSVEWMLKVHEMISRGAPVPDGVRLRYEVEMQKVIGNKKV